MKAIERLFEDWIRNRRHTIAERSGDIAGDTRGLLLEAMRYAREIGIDLANLEEYRDLRAYVAEIEGWEL